MLFAVLLATAAEAPDPILRDLLREAMDEPTSFTDKFEKRVWLQDMATRGDGAPDTHVFQSRKGGNHPITRRHALTILKKAFRACAMTGTLGTHSMRKTFANNVHNRLARDVVKTGSE